MNVADFIPQAAMWLTPILVLGMFFSFVRLVKGPSVPDRVVALDTVAVLAIGMLVLIAIGTDQALLLDVALAMALITFLGTVALAISFGKGTDQ